MKLMKQSSVPSYTLYVDQGLHASFLFLHILQTGRRYRLPEPLHGH